MLKLVFKGKQAREKIKRGVDLCADIVKQTLGPAGRNVLIEMAQKWPVITNDGVSIAKKIEVEDEIENLAVFTLVNAAHKTNEEAGDGTTTCVTIAQKIIEEGYKQLDKETDNIIVQENTVQKINAMSLKREVAEWCAKVTEELKLLTKPIKTKKELEGVAISAIEDETLGKTIANMVWQIGADGFIDVQDSFNNNLETEIIEGMKFYGKYAEDFMITDPKTKEAVFKDKPILVTNHSIEKLGQINNICAKVMNNNIMGMVIFAPEFSKEVISAIWNTANINRKYPNGAIAPFTILGVKIKSLTSDQIEDVAVFTGAKFIDKQKDIFLEKMEYGDLGKAEKVITGEERTIIMGGKVDNNELKKRITDLKIQLTFEKDDLFKKKLERRIAALASGIGIIKVGSKTDVETGYLKHKVEDVINATKAAMAEGIVKGGGLALKTIAEKLPTNILTEALKAPYNQIQANYGGTLEIPDWVVDPVKVTRSALQNACSIAGTLLTVEAVIAVKRRKLIDDLQDTITPTKQQLWDERLPQKDEEKYQEDWMRNAGNY